MITVMRFLLDVNASGALAGWLMELGHDVVRVSDKDPRMSEVPTHIIHFTGNVKDVPEILPAYWFGP